MRSEVVSAPASRKLILLDSLLQEVVVTLPHLVLQRPRTAKMREAPTGAGTPNKTSNKEITVRKRPLAHRELEKKKA